MADGVFYAAPVSREADRLAAMRLSLSILRVHR